MKKSLSAVIVILLSMVGLKNQASTIDQNIKKNVTETTDATGSQNEGSRTCGTKVTK